MDRLVPVVFTVPVQGREHDGQNGGGVVTDQTHDVPETKHGHGCSKIPPTQSLTLA